MRNNGTRFLFVSIVIALVAYLTYAGFKTATGQLAQEETQTEEADLKSRAESEQTRLSPELKNRIKQYAADTATVGKLITLLDSAGMPLSAAVAMKVRAEQTASLENWYNAGSRMYNLSMMTSDSGIIKAAGQEALEAFRKALEIKPSSLEAKNGLAACYIDIDHDIMKGVGLLKEIIATDSNNTQALFTLGMLSIQSGQLDKARQRFEQLVSLQPFTAEYYYYLAEVYAREGRKDLAIQTYEKCKTLLSDKSAQQEIESLIKKLKSI